MIEILDCFRDLCIVLLIVMVYKRINAIFFDLIRIKGELKINSLLIRSEINDLRKEVKENGTNN